MLSAGLGGGFEAEKMKRPLEEADEKAEVEVEAEGICREEGSADVEAFFALLEKIAATERLLGLRQGPNKTEAADKHMKTMETMKTTWRPAFEWQDFCSTANGTCDVAAAKAEEESSDSKEGIPDSNHETTRMCIDDDEDGNNCDGAGTESLDLNLPSASHGLQLSL